MKHSWRSASRLASFACLLVLHFCTATASRAAILAGPITNAANGHIYYLLSPTNWPSAEAEAVSLHGHLATINDAVENTWVFNRFATNGGVARSLWLGLNDAAHEGTWVWVSGEAAVYRNWAPGEPNSGGGYFPDEDQAVMRGPALSYPDSWNDAPSDQSHAAVAELIAITPPSNASIYDVSVDFSTNNNPNGVWSYGYSTTLGGPMTLHDERGNWAGLDFWRTDIWLGVPGVYFNAADHTATNATGTVVLGPRQLSFHPGPNGEFCLIRFTAPTNGQYRVSGVFTGVDTDGTTTDVHILVNGVTFNGLVNGYGPGSGPTFNLTTALHAEDRIDFAVGRGENNEFSFDSTGLAIQISLGSNAPPAGMGPTITSHPQSRTVNAGTNVSFFVTAAGTAPLSYQWRRNETNLAGANGPSLTLSNVQPANAGIYSVRVTNAFGAATSSNAVLTVLPPSTNCVAPPPGLVSWWRAENPAAGANTVLDSADANHGTLAGNAGYGAGRIGQALVLDGNGDGVRIGNPTNLQLQNFTIEAWVKRSSSSVVSFSLGGLWAEFFCYGGGGYAFGFLGDGRLFLSKVDIDQTQTSVAITDTNFHHVAVTKAGSVVVFYIDGVAYPVAPYDTTYTFTQPAAIGARGDNLTGSFYGAIDDLSIYNRGLSLAEIQAIYNADGAGKCTVGIAPVVTTHPQNQTAVAGANVTFTVAATGTAPLSYQWRRNETNLPGATGTSLTLSNVQPANAGSYSVRVTNAFGAVISSNAALTVLASGTNCVAPAPGLIGWWRAQGNANDATDGNNGTLSAGMSFVPGKVGQAFHFEGTNANVRVPASTSLNVGLGGGFTIETWISPSQLTSQRPLVEWNDGSTYGVHLWLFAWPNFEDGRALYLNVVDTSSQNHGIYTAAGTVTTNGYQHVAATYNKTNGVAALYLNGTMVVQQALGVFAPRTAGDLYFGFRPAGPSAGTRYLGAMDEVSIYNRPLGSDEIAGIFAAGSAGKCASLAGIPPTITSQPQSRTVNAGTNVPFTVTATGTAPLSYQWRRNETNLPGATGTTLTLSNVQPANAGTYSVRVTNAFGAATSSNAVLTVAVAAYDVSANYSLAANPNGVWRYGAMSNLAGPLTLLTFSRTFGADNGVPIGEWNPGGVLHPHVNKVLGPGTAVSAGGALVAPAGTVYFTPGEDGTPHNFGVIRFTVPAGGGGEYRIAAAVHAWFDGALSADSDFHVVRNGVELFGQALAPNQGTTYSNTLALAVGDTIDFAVGRGADGVLGTTGLKIQATVAQLTGTLPIVGSLGAISLIRESGATARLCFAGVAGNTYPVQASTNLVDWVVVGVSVADSNGVCEFEDPDSSRFSLRYYRVVLPGLTRSIWKPDEQGARVRAE